MAQISTAGRVAIIAGIGGAIYLTSRFAKAAGKKSTVKPGGPTLPNNPGTRQPGDPSIPGSGEIVPGPNNEGPVPLPKGWGGGQYGPGPIPDNFDWAGNLVYVSPDCKTLAEGWLFLPIPGFQVIENWWMPSNGGPSAQGSLAEALNYISPTGETGTAWGYIARLVARRARDGQAVDYKAICQQVFEELLEFQAQPPSCPDLFATGIKNTYPGLRLWRNNFLKRVTVGVDAFKDAWYQWNEFWDVE